MLQLLALVVSCPLVAPVPQAPELSDGARELAAVVRSYVEGRRVPGAVLLVAARGETLLHEAFGLLDLESGAPMEPGTSFEYSNARSNPPR